MIVATIVAATEAQHLSKENNMAKWIERRNTEELRIEDVVYRFVASVNPVPGNAATVVLRSYHCQGRRELQIVLHSMIFRIKGNQLPTMYSSLTRFAVLQRYPFNSII